MIDANPGYWARGRALHVIDLENLAGGRVSRRQALMIPPPLA
jgi:hypothetical protein